MKYIYIGGYGRSGSTIVDVVLGGSEDVVSLGEFASIFQEVEQGNSCSCGAKITECPFWGDFLSVVLKKYPLHQLIDAFHSVNRRRYFFRSLSPIDKEIFNFIQAEFISFVNAGCVVDSSKTAANAARRAGSLVELSEYDLYFVHLTRTFTDVVRSLLKGSNRSIQGDLAYRVGLLDQFGWQRKNQPKLSRSVGVFENVARGVFGYVLANLDAYFYKYKLSEGRYLRIDFEDFIRDPVAVIDEIQFYVGIDLSGSKETISSSAGFLCEHLIAGNRLARSGGAVIISGE